MNELAPLFRSMIGFEPLFDDYSNLSSRDSGNSYPPYNIEKISEDEYKITMAVAGFSEKDISILTENGKLKVTGNTENQEEKDEGEYLHRGIATRQFEHSYNLAEHMKVKDAELKDGLLTIGLFREIPEEAKPKMIPINGNKVIDHKN